MIPIVKRLASFLQRQTGCKVTVCDALENKGVKGKSVQTKGAAQRSQRLKGLCFGAFFGFIAEYDGDFGG